MDDLLKILDDTFQRGINGSGVLIEWRTPTGDEGETLLRTYGIKCWARQYGDGEEDGKPYGIRVGKAQASWADGLLRAAGFHMTSPHLGSTLKTLPQRDWGAPAKAQGLAGLVLGALGSGPKNKKTSAQRKAARRRSRR